MYLLKDGQKEMTLLGTLTVWSISCILMFASIFSASAVTARTLPSVAESVRPLGRHVTPSPASTAPSARTIRVTTPVNAGQVHQTFQRGRHAYSVTMSVCSSSVIEKTLDGTKNSKCRRFKVWAVELCHCRLRRASVRVGHQRVRQPSLHAWRQLHREVMEGRVWRGAPAAWTLWPALRCRLHLQVPSGDNR